MAGSIVSLDFSSQSILNPMESLMSDICQQSQGDEDLGLWIFGAMSSLGLCIGYLVAAVDWKYFLGTPGKYRQVPGKLW